MNRVQRAVIMAAGTGKRLRPITADVPKPLISINGRRIIDTIIQGLHDNNIYDIYIVVGYLKEKFQELKKDYFGLHFIDNPYYDCANNISSLYVARDFIENAIILDGDQIIYNSDILKPDFEKSGYNAVWTDGLTKEWLLQVQKGRVVSCSRNGGKKGWQLYSISRWTSNDGKRLRKHIVAAFNNNLLHNLYWDDVVMFCYFEQYDLGIMPMNIDDVKEIDNLCELVEIDAHYEKYLGTKLHKMEKLD